MAPLASANVMVATKSGRPPKVWETWHEAVALGLAGKREEAERKLDEVFADDVLFKPPTFVQSSMLCSRAARS